MHQPIPGPIPTENLKPEAVHLQIGTLVQEPELVQAEKLKTDLRLRKIKKAEHVPNPIQL
jgi:hypothetical protein